MAIQIQPKHIQESLVALYLRLNGFFTSGYIMHADTSNLAKREKGEIDILAVRLPFSREPETAVPVSPYLGIRQDTVEVVIGEVKSGKEKLQFNPSIRDASNVIRALRRAGFTNNEDVLRSIASSLVDRMPPLAVRPRPSPDFELINPKDVLLQPRGDICYPTRIRPILFHLGRELPKRNQVWFVGYGQIMEDIWKRLRPETQPDSCQRVYDYHLWGPVFDAIVTYFKDKDRNEPGTPDELVRALLA